MLGNCLIPFTSLSRNQEVCEDSKTPSTSSLSSLISKNTLQVPINN